MIEVTQVAAEKLASILKQRGPDVRLRVLAGVTGRAIRYTLALERSPQPTDVRFEAQDLPFVVDPQSVPLVRGGLIDWVTDGGQAGLSISNPKLDPAVLEQYFGEVACAECG